MSVNMRSQFDQRDEYGFLRPEDFDYAEYEQFMSSYLGVLAARRQKWDAMVRHGYHNISKVNTSHEYEYCFLILYSLPGCKVEEVCAEGCA